MRSFAWIPVATFSASLALWPAVISARDVFQTPRNGCNLGVWRITNDPTVRDWANYHNTQCWSHDGRFLCFTHDAGNKTGSEVHLYDFQEEKDRLVDRGDTPRWARGQNWLFYRQLARDSAADRYNSHIFWLDLATGKTTRIAEVADELELGETDADDQWLYGGRLHRDKASGGKSRSGLRIRIAASPLVEDLPQVKGYQFMTNPRHPVFFTRWKQGGGDFTASRNWYDLDGRNERIAAPMVQNCHFAWLGSGEYLMFGNGQVRGRRWNEPFPSNVHFLAATACGDISPCGRSGRYVCGGHGNVADLRSGDGWHAIHFLNIICFPADVADASEIFDADPKGSPDGTKIAFVTNYDLKDGPLAFLDELSPSRGDALCVRSTESFPNAGSLVVGREVIGYRRKTATTFEGLARKLHGTAEAPLKPGAAVTSFAARCLTDAQWQRRAGPSKAMRASIPDSKSPLARQRQTNVHVVVVRRPDRPHLRVAGGGAQLVPGEEHYETAGYHLLRDGRRITAKPLPAGASAELQPGEYRAVAVERSGLESEPSPPLRVATPAKLQVLAGAPKDFSWTSDRWLENRSVREIVHLHDGVIQREWYRDGQLARRHDLNAEGKAIRRLTFENGRLARREYHDRDGNLVSRELFDAGGFITESIRFVQQGDGSVGHDHWWYDRGTPVRRINGGQEFVKQGDQWVAAKKGERAEKKKHSR